MAMLNGEPLLLRSLRIAKQSKLTRLIVSTDSEDMAQIAKVNGGDVPFLRPFGIAQDNSPIEDALTHGLEFCEKQEGTKYDILVLLQNSSPFRLAEDIDKAIDKLEWGFTSALTVSVEEHIHPELSWKLSAGDAVQLGKQDLTHYRRQDRDVIYYENGLVYAILRDNFMVHNDLRMSPTALIEVPKIRALDIHDESDLIIANALAQTYF